MVVLAALEGTAGTAGMAGTWMAKRMKIVTSMENLRLEMAGRAELEETAETVAMVETPLTKKGPAPAPVPVPVIAASLVTAAAGLAPVVAASPVTTTSVQEMAVGAEMLAMVGRAETGETLNVKAVASGADQATAVTVDPLAMEATVAEEEM